MSDDIAGWLEGLGLGQYSQAFADSKIGLDILPHLSDDDLKELGLPLGDRRRLQLALGSLTTAQERENAAPSQRSKYQPDAPPEAERRHLTVRFCDLVGSITLAARLDPEDYRPVMRSCQEAASSSVARYDGHVAKYRGDGVLAYFGWPRAHEDDAERAVRAGHALEARVGIATRSG